MALYLVVLDLSSFNGDFYPFETELYMSMQM